MARSGRLAHAQGRGDGRLHQRRVAQRGEVDEPDAVRVAVSDVTRDRQREARLAAAARAGQGDDAALDEIGADRLDLLRPTDEARDLARQVRGDVERPERARVVGDAGHDQPVERRRVFEVLDRPQPIVDELDVAEAPRPRKLLGHGRDDGIGHDDLAAVRRGRDPGRVVHVDPDVVVVDIRPGAP